MAYMTGFFPPRVFSVCCLNFFILGHSEEGVTDIEYDFIRRIYIYVHTSDTLLHKYLPGNK